MKTACPNSVIEALNHGIPVLGYESGSMREIVDEKFGKLIKVDNNFKIDPKEVSKQIDIINTNYSDFNKNLKTLIKNLV